MPSLRSPKLRNCHPPVPANRLRATMPPSPALRSLHKLRTTGAPLAPFAAVDPFRCPERDTLRR
ncbi:MAG TPA: hypothetical protein VG796_07220 [Verrucomicrobiales bacterium]|nr:hypothetical protein [Verrucomicrobiales bacterium]